MSPTTHTHIPRITLYPETSSIIVNDFAKREATKPPPPRSNPSSPRHKGVGDTRVLANEQHEGSTRRSFPLYDNVHHEEDGTYYRGCHTLMSNSSTTHPPNSRPPQTSGTANRHNIISRSFFTTSKQQQQHRIRSSVRNELMTKTSSPPPSPPCPK